MGIALMIGGFMIAVFGAKLYSMPEYEKPEAFKTLGGNLVILIIQLTGWGLVVFGVIKLIF